MLLRTFLMSTAYPKLRAVIPGVGNRMVGHLFPSRSGDVWFMVDPEWHITIGAQPVHILTGPVKGSGPWMIGDTRIETIPEHDRDFPAAVDWALTVHEFNLHLRAREMLVTSGHIPA